MKRSWCGEVRTVSVLVTICVGDDGYWEIIGVAEGAKEDKEEGRLGFLCRPIGVFYVSAGRSHYPNIAPPHRKRL